MTRRVLATAFALALAALAGCSSEPPAPAPPAVEERYWLRPGLGEPSSPATSLLHYYDYVRSLGPAQQEEERDRQRRAWADDPTDFRRVQYALALGVPPASPDDRRLVLQLLGPLAREDEGHDPELHLLAVVLLHEQSLELRLDATKDLERRANSARDLERRLDAATRELERRGETMKDMERKLDAMKDIERQLLQRGRAPSRETRQ